MLNSQNNRLAKICAELMSSELSMIIKSIYEYEDTETLSPDSRFYKFVDEIHLKYDIPKDYRMIEHAVLFEAARRYHNTCSIGNGTGGIGHSIINKSNH